MMLSVSHSLSFVFFFPLSPFTVSLLAGQEQDDGARGGKQKKERDVGKKADGEAPFSLSDFVDAELPFPFPPPCLLPHQELSLVSTDEQRSAVLAQVEATDDWMYDEGKRPRALPRSSLALPLFSTQSPSFGSPTAPNGARCPFPPSLCPSFPLSSPPFPQAGTWRPQCTRRGPPKSVPWPCRSSCAKPKGQVEPVLRHLRRRSRMWQR